MAEIGAIELERVLIDALAPTPDAVLIDRPDWAQLTTPSLPHSSCNGVYLARLSPDTADARIEQVKRAHVERGAGMRWVVGPSSTPDDLSARLERAGIPVHMHALGMHMSVPRVAPELPAGVELRRVGVGDIDTYAQINARAWESSAAFRRDSEAFITRTLAREDDTRLVWLVYRDAQLIGTANLCVLPGVGYLQGAAILREHRRQGMYQALLDHRLGVLRSRGIDHVVVWASETTSAGVCQRAGFVTKCRAAFHVLPALDPDLSRTKP